MILAMYLAVPPDTLRFAYGRRGKPSLQAPTAGIYFNVAHADRLFLCAVAGEPVLGIDVERVHPFDELDSLAETCFSAAELAIFQSLAGEHRTRAFFTGWTRKEAFIKAVGDGLGYPLDGFDVALGPDEVPRILAVRAEPTGASEWVLHALEPGEPYLAAVVAGPPANAVHCWFWQAATARDVVLSQRCCAGATDSPPGPVCD